MLYFRLAPPGGSSSGAAVSGGGGGGGAAHWQWSTSKRLWLPTSAVSGRLRLFDSELRLQQLQQLYLLCDGGKGSLYKQAVVLTRSHATPHPGRQHLVRQRQREPRPRRPPAHPPPRAGGPAGSQGPRALRAPPRAAAPRASHHVRRPAKPQPGERAGRWRLWQRRVAVAVAAGGAGACAHWRRRRRGGGARGVPVPAEPARHDGPSRYPG